MDYYHVSPPAERWKIHDSHELENALRRQLADVESRGGALALSGGIDSAILARMMPRGSVAYTFKCVVPGVDVVDETEMARRYAEECGLDHRIVEVYWEDMVSLSPKLMLHKGAPIHSIEVQIYKAGLRAKSDGFRCLVFGESADCLYGGLSGLLSRNWTVGEFIDRYSYVLPYRVLKRFKLITEPYTRFEHDGFIDVHAFNSNVFLEESTNSYYNASATAGLQIDLPYAMTEMALPLDMKRVRSGENKYLVRELFHRLYPGWEVPEKIPMPRPLNEWMKNWTGPDRPEFWPHCAQNMTGDQKWYIYALASFLDILDKKR